LVKELVELHGGSVEAANAPAGGARFEMALPDSDGSGPNLRNPAAIEEARYRTLDPRDYNIIHQSDGDGTVLPPQQTAEATVLVAEDDAVLRESLGRLLRGRYRVLLASDGEVALRLARKYLPDLLVSDVDMPNMDGIELVRRFQAIPELQMPSTILLTAISGLADRLIGLEAGAVDYVPKPFEPDEVLARVAAQLALRRRALDAARKENLSALGTMVKGLMHELRNPANGLVHSVRLLRELLPAELLVKEGAADELLGVAELCASQIESMCVDLIGTNGRGDPVRKVVPFGQIASRATALVSGFLTETKLHCDLGYDGAVFCSEPLIAQVLANLIKNGAQAAGPSGWVRLASEVREGHLVVEVTDSGPGVPEHLRERIFELFFTTKQSGQGSGLGLPMSRQIVERHGGVLDVREGPEGTMFHMSLPLGAEARESVH
jgi:signal transduction histidine kinase